MFNFIISIFVLLHQQSQNLIVFDLSMKDLKLYIFLSTIKKRVGTVYLRYIAAISRPESNTLNIDSISQSINHSIDQLTIQQINNSNIISKDQLKVNIKLNPVNDTCSMQYIIH